MKHKIESQNEVKAKEQEEKEVISQQVICLAILGYLLITCHIYDSISLSSITLNKSSCICTVAEYVCSVIATCFARTTNAWNGRWLCPSPSNGRRIWDASNASFWHAHGQQLLTGKGPWFIQQWKSKNGDQCGRLCLYKFSGGF